MGEFDDDVDFVFVGLYDIVFELCIVCLVEVFCKGVEVYLFSVFFGIFVECYFVVGNLYVWIVEGFRLCFGVLCVECGYEFVEYVSGGFIGCFGVSRC